MTAQVAKTTRFSSLAARLNTRLYGVASYVNDAIQSMTFDQRGTPEYAEAQKNALNQISVQADWIVMEHGFDIKQMLRRVWLDNPSDTYGVALMCAAAQAQHRDPGALIREFNLIMDPDRYLKHIRAQGHVMELTADF